MDSNELGHSDYLHSSESLLECPHELQNQHAWTLPHPLLRAGSDWFFLFRVCGPVYPALQQPKDRWAKHTESKSRVSCRAKLHQVTLCDHHLHFTSFTASGIKDCLRSQRFTENTFTYLQSAHVIFIFLSTTSCRLPLGTASVPRRMQPGSSLPLRLCLAFLKAALCIETHTHKRLANR